MGVPLDVGRLILFEDFEITELVQAQEAQLPKPRIENIAFIEQDLATDHFIARSGVPGEIDAANEELLSLFRRQREVDFVGVGNDVEGRLGDRVDVAELPIQLAQVLKSLAQLGRREDVAFRHLEQRLHQRVGRAEQLYSGERDLVEVIQPALFNG